MAKTIRRERGESERDFLSKKRLVMSKKGGKYTFSYTDGSEWE